MNCKQILKHIDEYHEGTLDKVLNELIENHLETCPDCKQAMEKERSVSDFLKKVNGSVPAISVVDDVLKKLEDIDRATTSELKSDPERIKDSRYKWLMIVALLMGIGLIGILVIPFDSRMDEHNVGHYAGPGYTWMGDVPLEDPLETRWYDSELYDPAQAGTQETDGQIQENDEGHTGRVVHILKFGEPSEPTDTTTEVEP